MFDLDLQSRTPIYEQLYKKTIELIIKGVLKENEQLPSVRSLAKEIGVNPNTVAKAYQELERQGVIETIRAKGTFIARKVELQADDRKLSALHQSLSSIALELKMMGYTKEQTMELMAEAFEEI